MQQYSKANLLIKYNELVSRAKDGSGNFVNELSNFIVKEFGYQAIVFFKTANENSFQVLGKSSTAKKNYLIGSEFKCRVCKAADSSSKNFHSDSKCEIQISEYLVYEICSKFSIGNNDSILLKVAKKTSFNQSDLDYLAEVIEFVKFVLKIWIAAKGGRIDAIDKSFQEIVSETALGLRNPANSIIGFISILNEDNLTSSQAEYVTTIKKHAQDLLASINDLYDLTKYESNKLQTNARSVDLEKLLHEILDALSTKTDDIDYNIKLSKDLNKTIITDMQKLRYVLQNIIMTAGAISTAGPVKIELEQIGENKIQFSINSKKDFVDVRDNFNIFKPFECNQIDSLKNTNITGLSFTLAKKYVNMLGGDISFSSNSTNGFNFVFTIEGEKMSQLESTLSSLPKPDKNNKVLVIEDDYPTAKLLNNYLSKWGYEPVIVNTEDQTFEKIEKELYLAVILDIDLPNTNGLELLKKINEHPNTKNTPVIISAVESEEQKAYMMGAVEYFIKPINYNYLVEVLTSYKLRKDSKILCVDDDVPTLNLLKQAVETAGFNAVAENVSANVMDLIKDQDIDLAIIDLDMPHPNGFELIKLIKSEQKFSNLPIIIYTGKENYQEDLKQVDGLFEDLLSKKSTNIEDLQDVINSMINRYETPPPAEEVIEKADDVVKILLAEDYKHSQIIVTRLLKKNSFENIVVVDNGEDALNYAKKEKFSLILMDMQMPIMNGFEATENIRRLEGYKDTPIIALTAFAMKGDREKCIEAGATDYIPKPIDSKEFIEKVKYYTKVES